MAPKWCSFAKYQKREYHYDGGSMKSVFVCVGVIGLLALLSPQSVAFAGPSYFDALWNGPEKEALYVPIADIMPEPMGGYGAIIKHVVYPESARKIGIEGKVYLVAYISETGEVDDVKVIKGLQAGCEEAAVKAIKETKFSPGKQGGSAVKVQLSIPVTFKLTK